MGQLRYYSPNAKQHFLKAYEAASNLAITKANILAGFKATGIVSMNVNRVGA